MKTNHIATEPLESALAADEFATWIVKNGPRLQKREHYEVHPCKCVRGFMLRLPGIGWKFWFPTAGEALAFAHRAASFYPADCLVFDTMGQRIT